MARRPGPAPSPDHQRRNVDTVVGKDGWTEIDPNASRGEIPPLPAWVESTPRLEAVYEYLMSLPQAQLYGPGTLFELWLSMPLIERYLEKPGSENYKALVSTLGAALRLTEDDMARGRVKFKAAEVEEDPDEASNAEVAYLDDRRARLTKAHA